MFIDSHCHINFPELAEKLDELLANMRQNEVTHALCVSSAYRAIWNGNATVFVHISGLQLNAASH